jgi:hypothetical protein
MMVLAGQVVKEWLMAPSCYRLYGRSVPVQKLEKLEKLGKARNTCFSFI